MVIPASTSADARTLVFANRQDQESYLRWRDWKISHLPQRLDELLAEVRDPRKVTASQRMTLIQRCSAVI